MNTCTAISKFDGATMARGLYWHWHKNPFLWIGFPVLGVLGFGLGLADLYFHRTPKLSDIILFVVSFFLAFRYLIAVWQFRARLASHPLHDSEMLWSFSEAGLELKTNHATTKTDWAAYIRTYTTPDGFLLYPQKRLFYWIPRCAFPSADQAASLEEILSRQPHHRRLS